MSNINLSARGTLVSLDIVRGLPVRPITVLITDPEDVAVDLTGIVVAASIKHKASDAEPAATFTVTLDPTLGQITLDMSADDTGALDADDDHTAHKNQYVWDLLLTDSFGGLQLLRGPVRVFLPATTP